MMGCKKKCPCRTWSNCSAYVDETKKNQRLSLKETEGYRSEIIKWYRDHFKYEPYQAYLNFG